MATQDPIPQHLEVGQWLGATNPIVALELFRYGWRATDSTGVHYRQDRFKDGLLVSWGPEGEKVRTPWPPRGDAR